MERVLGEEVQFPKIFLYEGSVLGYSCFASFRLEILPAPRETMRFFLILRLKICFSRLVATFLGFFGLIPFDMLEVIYQHLGFSPGPQYIACFHSRKYLAAR